MRCCSRLRTRIVRFCRTLLCYSLTHALARIGRPQTQQVTNRENKVSAIHRVEVECRDAAIDKIEHLLGSNGSGDQLACRRIVIEPLKPFSNPAGHGCAAALGKIGGCLKFWTGRIPGTIGISIPRARTRSRYRK